MRLGWRSSALPSASWPSWAVITSKPSSRRLTSTNRTMSRSSSAIRTISSTSARPPVHRGATAFDLLSPPNPLVDELPERLGGRGRVVGPEDGGADHEGVGARGQAPGQAGGVDAPVDLEGDRSPDLVDGPAGG